MRRGLTLIELLLAVVLMTALIAAGVGWLRVAVTATVETAPAVRRQAAAETVFRIIEDDLWQGDFAADSVRVEVDDTILKIHTRGVVDDGVAAVVHEYRLDGTRRELQRRAVTAEGVGEIRLLLDAVRAWRCELTEEDSPSLTVEIELREGQPMTRTFAVPGAPP